MKTVAVSLFAIVAAILCLVPVAQAQYCTPGWSSAPNDLAAPITKAGGGAYFNYVYIWGGVDSSGVGQTNTLYHAANSGGWYSSGSLPEAKWFGGSAIVGDYGYAVAGWNASNNFTVHCYELDIWAGTWSAIADYPQAWGKMACSDGGDGNLYCFGGADMTSSYANSYVYDPVADTWTAIASMPAAASGHVATYNEADGLIYISGGWQALTASYTYDPATDTYTTLSAMNTGRHWPSMAAAGGLVWLAGGADEWTPVVGNDEYYDTAWSDAGTTMSTTVLAGVGGYVPWYGIFSIGGQTGGSDSNATDENQVWNPCIPLWEETDANIGMPGDTLTITGSHFQAGASAWLYDNQKAAYPLTNLTVPHSLSMSGDVPSGLAKGMYGLAIANEMGQLMTLDGAFYVSENADELILDDSTNELGLSPPNDNSQMVQQFTLASGSAKLKRVKFMSNSFTRIYQPLRLVVYIQNTVKNKAAPSGFPVYISDPFYIEYPGKWNVIDLSEVAVIQAAPITGDFYVGIEVPDTNINYGPYIGIDDSATPNDAAWQYTVATSTWENVNTDLGFPGALMFRPTVEYGCLINDVAYDDMEINPTNPCERCEVSVADDAWTPLADATTCDDGEFCTVDDACASGVCEGTARDCDDGDYCTGVETCNETTDSCDSSGDPCGDDETCNETTDSCDPAGDDDDDDTADDDDDDDDDNNDDDDTATPSGGDDDDDDDGCCGC